MGTCSKGIEVLYPVGTRLMKRDMSVGELDDSGGRVIAGEYSHSSEVIRARVLALVDQVIMHGVIF